MPDVFYGTAYVAGHIGSTQSSVSNWAKNEDSGMPEPTVVIVSASGGISARGWSESQLTEVRAWMAERLGLSEAEAVKHWETITRNQEERIRIHKDGVSPQQERLF